MATRSNRKTKAARRTSSESKVTVDRGENGRTDKKSEGNFLDKIQNDLEKNQSYLNLILGALIVIVLGVLIFNYFNKPASDEGNITPQAEQATDENGDVSKESLPGKYTVKEGDTLTVIAQKYYDDGSKYTEIIRENNLTSENIEVGQELTIPELEIALDSSASPSPQAQASDSANVDSTPSPQASTVPVSEASTVPAPVGGKGGALNQTTWGETISGDSYTIAPNDWLSKIAGRAYGDIYKYEIIAKANNISDPNTIEVGTVLKIPRD